MTARHYRCVSVLEGAGQHAGEQLDEEGQRELSEWNNDEHRERNQKKQVRHSPDKLGHDVKHAPAPTHLPSFSPGQCVAIEDTEQKAR